MLEVSHGDHDRKEIEGVTNTNSKQELLPPISKEPVGLSGWLEWLITPLPGQIMLPATGFLIMGLDWLFF